MVRLLAIALLLVAATAAAADEETRILVTFADPGMSNAARPGPSRPAYTRRSSTYLVSVGVRRAADRVARDFGLETVDEWPIVPLNVHCLVYAVEDATTVDTLLEALRERPEVESAQRLNQFEVNGTQTDPYARLQHTLDTLELGAAHALSRGAGTSVTIVDTGADLQHPELVTQIRSHEDFVGRGEFDHDAHGTAVAGIIGAASDNGFGMTGVAPDAELTLLRACWHTAEGEHAVCDSFTLAKALTHALESGTNIINLSLGGPPDALLERLLLLALENGIVVVAAASQRSGFPTDVPGVIVAGATAADATAAVLAPGDEILVPVPGGGFDYASGTSLAAAHVSGVIALLLAERPGLSGSDVTTLLAASKATDGASINACRALAQLLHNDGCRNSAAARNSP